MLSRTADNLFWIARAMERAETAARALEVGSRISLIPSVEGYRSEWDSLLRASGTAADFALKYGERNQPNVESWLFFDHDNPASVARCITQARENGRIVRAALTAQVWDALNMAYQELRALECEEQPVDQSQLTEWVLRQTAMLRGAIDATLLRDDGYNFLNIGFYLERADNTARLLDVKYYVLLPRLDFVGSGLDNYQWSTLLRALGAQRSFHWAYGGEITAGKIADFLILNPQSPRALITCVAGIENHLGRLARIYRRETAAQQKAREIKAELEAESVERIFDEGLHEYLTRFLRSISDLGSVIQQVYLSGETR